MIITEEYPHTAISTWSGFVYQGKVALYHCLRLLEKSYDDSKCYRLQLESADDFAVYLADKCISIHQVKAYKDGSFSKYRGAVKKQVTDSLKYPGASVYFHVSTCINDLPEGFNVKYKPVSIYTYRSNGIDQNFCNLSDLDQLVETEISEIYKKAGEGSSHKLSGPYLERSRNILENIIIDKVIDVHAKIQREGKATDREIAAKEYISFSKICDVLEDELTEALLTEDFFFKQLLIDIGTYYKRFFDEACRDDGDVCNFDKLDSYIALLCGLDKRRLRDFIKSVLPQKRGEFKNIDQYKSETFSLEDLRDGLFRVLDRLTTAGIEREKRLVFSWFHEGRFYYPTALRGSELIDAKKICKRIIQNSIANEVEFLYESGVLVTVGVDVESLPSVYSVGPNSMDEDNALSHRRIAHFKDISLVSYSKVSEDLKDE
ncbi:ABC-three component system protein [Marinobacter sp. GN3S48]|uniref:ABC-three component system protein n=1 Tax=Marinobacter sp. GN3S48 TaxID=3382302 RepID=UPI00387B30A8